jgi:hypothetical protein
VARLRQNGYPSLWIHEESGAELSIHLAFTADHTTAVDAFHAAALANGGTDNAVRASANAITTTTTPLISSIPTVTVSKPSARRSSAAKGIIGRCQGLGSVSTPTLATGGLPRQVFFDDVRIPFANRIGEEGPPSTA